MSHLMIFIITLATAPLKHQPDILQYAMTVNKTIGYRMELSFTGSRFTIEAEFQMASQVSDTLTVNAVITKLEWSGNAKTDKEINEGYKSYISRQLYFKMTPSGKIIRPLTYKDTDEDASSAFDVKLFFPEYSDGKVGKGDSWQTKWPLTDFIFKSIQAKYTLKTDIGENALIEMKCKYIDPGKMGRKELDGVYIIDGTSREVKNGKFKLSGFSGISNIFGSLTIDRLTN